MFDSVSFSSESFDPSSWLGLEEVVKKIRKKRKESISVSGDLNIPLLMNQKIYKDVPLTSNRKQLIQEDEEIVLLVQSLFLEGVLN
jgi:hypothetical protein